MSGKATSWFERVVLRGIEGIIGDRLLAAALERPVIGEGLHDYFEARPMSEQIYNDLRGWGFNSKRTRRRKRVTV